MFSKFFSTTFCYFFKNLNKRCDKNSVDVFYRELSQFQCDCWPWFPKIEPFCSYRSHTSSNTQCYSTAVPIRGPEFRVSICRGASPSVGSVQESRRVSALFLCWLLLFEHTTLQCHRSRHREGVGNGMKASNTLDFFKV